MYWSKSHVSKMNHIKSLTTIVAVVFLGFLIGLSISKRVFSRKEVSLFTTQCCSHFDQVAVLCVP